MKKTFVCVLLVIVISMFASVFTAYADEPVTVGFAAASSGWPWYATFIQHVEDRCKANGWESVILSADGDVATQLNQVLDLIEKKVDYIILGPLDALASVPALEKAHEAGIPVIIIGNDIDEQYWDLVAPSSSSATILMNSTGIWSPLSASSMTAISAAALPKSWLTS